MKRVPAARRPDHAHRRRARDRRRATSASRRARTRSARSRRRSASSRRTAATSPCSRVGPPEAEEQLRYALSVGADRGVLLADRRRRELGPDAGDRRGDRRGRRSADGGGPFDLILFGNESADAGDFQVGIRVARALGRPIVNGIKGMSVDGGTARGEQEVAGRREVYRLPLPAVVGVKEGINLPRYPSVPAKLRARKKPVARIAPQLAGPQLEKQRLLLPEGQGGQARIAIRCALRALVQLRIALLFSKGAAARRKQQND